MFYFYALKIGPASRVAPVDKLSLVFTIVLAALVLRESTGPLTLAGAFLMVAGAVLITLSR